MLPSWFIDLGRALGGLVAFSLCALFSAAALVPCWFLYHAILAYSSPFWAFLSTPFLFGVWGITYLILAIVFKHAIFYYPKKGEYPLFSAPTIKWALVGALTNWANTLILVHFKGTDVVNMYVRAMGMKVGRRVSMNSILFFDWDLLTVGDDVIFGGDCVVLGHLVESGKMKMAPVVIGNNVLIGTAARVMPGCIIGDRAVIAAGTIMKKGQVIPPNEVWGGTPCRFIRKRDQKELENDDATKPSEPAESPA